MTSTRLLTGSVLALLATASVPALAVTDQDLLNDAQTPGDVLTYGLGYKAQRFSPLDQISRPRSSIWYRPGPCPSAARSSAARKPALRVRRHALHHRLVLAHLRGRRAGPARRNGSMTRGCPTASCHAAMSSIAVPHLPGQGLLHHTRCAARGPEQGHGQGRLAQEDGELPGRLLEYRRTAGRQRQGDRRQFRRRVRDRRRGQGLRCRDRRGGLVPADRRGQHGSRSAARIPPHRHDQRHLARRHVAAWRCGHLARRHLRSRARTCCSSAPASRRPGTAGCARRQSLQLLDAGHRPGQRRDQVALPGHAARRLGLRRRQRVHPVRAREGRQEDPCRRQGRSQRVLLRARPTNGEFISASPFVSKITWAKG